MLPDGQTPKPEYKPVNRIDEISLKHDIYYREHPAQRDWLKGDDIMLEELHNIDEPLSKWERCECGIVIF